MAASLSSPAGPCSSTSSWVGPGALVQIRAAGGELLPPVHLSVLCAQCEWFAARQAGGWSEAYGQGAGGTSVAVADLSQFSAPVLRALLLWAHTGQLATCRPCTGRSKPLSFAKSKSIG